jgi:cell division protein FtsN
VLLERLTSDGYSAYLSRAIVSNQEVFRVRVGPFDTLPAAEEMASKLHRDGYSDARIAR